MLWLQAIVSFILWLVPGVLLWRHQERLRAWLMGLGRRMRVFMGSLGMVLGLGVLMGGMVLVAGNGGLKNGSLVPWAWLAVILLGALFVSIQALGAAAMLSLIAPGETNSENKASNSPETPNP